MEKAAKQLEDQVKKAQEDIDNLKQEDQKAAKTFDSIQKE